MNISTIIDKAKKLGLNIGDGQNNEETLELIASELGFADFDKSQDLDSLNAELDYRLNTETLYDDPDFSEDASDIENLQEEPNFSQNNSDTNNNPNGEVNQGQNKQKFGEKEYNAAKDEKGDYNKDYYKSKGKELDEKVNAAKEEKNKNWKLKNGEKGPVKQDGSNTSKKNFRDKVRDNANVVKAKKEKLDNSIAGAKSKAYRALHPGEALKEKTKGKVKDTAKNVGKKVVKTTVKGIKRLISLLAKINPILLIIILVAVFFFFIILFSAFFSDDDDNNSSSSSSQTYSSSSTLKQTNQSQSSFKELTNKHYENTESEESTIFKENLDKIYDIATKNNINPELVIIFAEQVEYQPGGETNNFWFLGCNSEEGCASYESFDEGLEAFIEFATKYETLDEFINGYISMGSKYWIYENSATTMSCKVLPDLEDYLVKSRYDEIKSACDNASNCNSETGENCLSKTTEDYNAFTKMKADEISKSFGNIYNHYEENNFSDRCTIYAQSDSRWGSKLLGKSSSKMSGYGCAVTSVAIGISCSGTKIIVDDFDAGKFVDILNENDCFTESGGIYWNCKGINKVAPDFNYYSQNRNLTGMSNAQKITEINQYSLNEYVVLIHFINEKHRSGHFVVYSKTMGDSLEVLDPAGGKVSQVALSDVAGYIVYEFKKDDYNWNTSIDSNASSNETQEEIKVLNEPLKTYLSESEYNSINDLIYNSVINAGVGTRNALVAAATVVTDYLAENKKVSLPYTWGGGHYALIGSDEENLNKSVTSFYGLNPNWGTKIDYAANDTVYSNLGLDCSGWVSWVLHNAGLNSGVYTSGGFLALGDNHKFGGDYIGKPGDLLIFGGVHASIIVGVDEDEKVYYVSETTDKNGKGNIITKIAFDFKYYVENYQIVDMTNYLNNPDNINNKYETDFKEGMINY